MTDPAEILVTIFIVLGGVFGLVGSYGLLKLRDTMQRLHGPTKATTLGIGSVLIASMIHALAVKGALSFHELLITLFLLLTAPITANFIAKAYIIRNSDRTKLPGTGGRYGWSVYDDAPGPSEATTGEQGSSQD
ncbi:pH adaption potassium efflux system protein PhaG [Pseudooceanicola batsensis HTCC2597]|uniref:pH adaption potassium efflux system protein PhaG n=1 Tax=Pseudooceanicola batsensis (strain ATCC BAA-863 / DSM 15984 / KCTC 12145 / HTCC2597) TaxID=252305 RepID=A3TUQ6_PSEBH|nr:Na+/H+ antiporter subunit G [Pseudooceanicola batsensis]EAQ04252.1 pH adaption potassium efflux system protein PhaG [Pseudooceanicola batsensis HTCC2597]